MNHLKTHQTNPTTAQYRPVQSNTSTAQYSQVQPIPEPDPKPELFGQTRPEPDAKSKSPTRQTLPLSPILVSLTIKRPFFGRLPLFSFLKTFKDELNRGNSNPAFIIHFSRLLKGCVSDNWNQLNVIWFCGLGRYLHHGGGDCQKVV